jgi:hypothetical protein
VEDKYYILNVDSSGVHCYKATAMTMPIAGTWRSGADTSCVGTGSKRSVLQSKMVKVLHALFIALLSVLNLLRGCLQCRSMTITGFPPQSSSTSQDRFNRHLTFSVFSNEAYQAYTLAPPAWGSATWSCRRSAMGKR